MKAFSSIFFPVKNPAAWLLPYHYQYCVIYLSPAQIYFSYLRNYDMNRETPLDFCGSSYQRFYNHLNWSTKVSPVTEIHSKVVPTEVKSLVYMIIVFGCSLEVVPPYHAWVHLHHGMVWRRQIPFQIKYCPREKILNFRQGRCKAPSQTSSDPLIHSHCAQLLAKTDIVKGSFDMFHLMIVLHLWNQMVILRNYNRRES